MKNNIIFGVATLVCCAALSQNTSSNESDLATQKLASWDIRLKSGQEKISGGYYAHIIKNNNKWEVKEISQIPPHITDYENEEAFAFDPNNDIVLKTGNTVAGVVPGTIGISINTTELPKVFSLKQNYPNPFNTVTNIKFDVPKRSNVVLRVFDITGRVVTEVYNGLSEPGVYTADFDAVNLASGIYYYEIAATSEAGSILFRDVKKMAVVK